MAAVIKGDVIAKTKTPGQLCEIMVTDKAYQLHYKKVDIGYTAKTIVKKLLQGKKISELL